MTSFALSWNTCATRICTAALGYEFALKISPVLHTWCWIYSCMHILIWNQDVARCFFFIFFYNLVIYVSHALLFILFFPKIFEMKASLHGYIFGTGRGVRRRPDANYANARDFRVDRFVKSC